MKARETQDNPADRHAWKLRLVRGLYERGFSAHEVRELFRLVDWLMSPPPALQDVFRKDFDRIQEEQRMPYVTEYERSARREGIRIGIEAILQMRFGDEGLKLMPEIRGAHEEDCLLAILDAVKTGASLEEVRRLWTPPSS